MQRIRRRADLGHHPQRAAERRPAGAACARRLRPFRRPGFALRPGVRRADRPSRRHRASAQARRRAEPHPARRSQEARPHHDLRSDRSQRGDDRQRRAAAALHRLFHALDRGGQGHVGPGRRRPIARPSTSTAARLAASSRSAARAPITPIATARGCMSRPIRSRWWTPPVAATRSTQASSRRSTTAWTPKRASGSLRRPRPLLRAASAPMPASFRSERRWSGWSRTHERPALTCPAKRAAPTLSIRHGCPGVSTDWMRFASTACLLQSVQAAAVC